ncbi:small acid-soluble spore protein K [Aureibacillus halotolerans]|nr:small acid-soluble spore protein K [Aureibacillus halotolerans]
MRKRSKNSPPRLSVERMPSDQFSSKRADGTINSRPAERMRAGGISDE